MAEAKTLNDESDAVRVFVAAMVWGYGRVGYGPFRTARVLAENSSAPEVLLEAAVRERGATADRRPLPGSRRTG